MTMDAIWLNGILLFLSAFLAGLSVFLFKTVKEYQFKLALIFAGSYLFSITILHIIPELFIEAVNPAQVGLFLLVGFFLQFFLELMTSGVEHGHIHKLNEHQHVSSTFLLLFGLCFHSIMEGSILAHPSTLHAHHHATGLLLGIILHKIPAAFALMSILTYHLKNKKTAILLLLIFSLASPAGILLADEMVKGQILANSTFIIIFAIVSGNFIKISTTILFESSPEHHFNFNKMIVSLFGALLAVLIEFFF